MCKKIQYLLVVAATLIFFMNPFMAEAQRSNPDYTVAVGLRAGVSSGLSAKLLFGQHIGFEGIAGLELQGGATFAFLFQYHGAIVEDSGFRWLLGAGVNYKTANRKSLPDTKYTGANLIAGIDWKIKRAPINITLDVKPVLRFSSVYSGRILLDSGLSLRYAF